MLINIWSIALLVSTAASVFAAFGVLPTAINAVRFWDSEADTQYQIQLEKQTWLTALLVQYLLFFQLVSLLLLVLTADNFAGVLAGAMCATGSLLANVYGMPAVYLKIAGVFLYGFWIVLHRLDLCSEYSPLIRVKYYYFLFLLPWLLADCYFLTSYLLNLEPDVITSCCGVIFSASSENIGLLVAPISSGVLLTIFYGLTAALIMASIIKYTYFLSHHRSGPLLTLGWGIFFLVSLYALTFYFSSYIYLMPSHRCPFDMLRSSYNYIGYPLYVLLFGASFCGISAGLVGLLRQRPGLQRVTDRYQKIASRLSLAMLTSFVAILSYFPLIYHLGGGER